VTVAIVGSSHAGVEVAAQLRTSGFANAIVLISDEPDLPYHRPPLSKGATAKGHVAQPLRPEPFYEENGIELELGRRAIKLDRTCRRVTLHGGRTISYDHLVLACGARPRRLDAFPDVVHRLHTLRNLADAKVLHDAVVSARSVAVIGGGMIGQEIASVAAAVGCNVHVIERGSRLMMRAAAPSVATFVADLMKSKGIEIRLESAVTAIAASGGGHRICLSSGEILAADLVLTAVGTVPNVELAQEAGLDVADGIACDAFGVTSDPHISAVGDCSAWYDQRLSRHVRFEAIHCALDQARIVAARLVGIPVPERAVPRYWSDQFGVKLHMAALPDAPDHYVSRGTQADSSFSVFAFAKDRLVGIHTVNRPHELNAGQKLIGAPLRSSASNIADPSFSLGDLMVHAH
jgi:3-phenylpropionate/trans-cinnamate dioxygenase ferredoxin reductase component